MIDHIVLTVSKVEHSSAFYEAALVRDQVRGSNPCRGAKPLIMNK
jgi:hypothetical protein